MSGSSRGGGTRSLSPFRHNAQHGGNKMGDDDVMEHDMEGMILAAGLGTRLRPLTDSTPKALVEVQGVPLLQLLLNRMAQAGARHVVVNVHHLADQVEAFVRQHPCSMTVSISDERAQLLDTGGALAHAAPLFSGRESVLIHNVDVLSRIDFAALVRWHQAQHHLATLCVSQRTTKRLLRFSPEGQLEGRASEGSEPDACTLAFSGIAMVEPSLFALLPAADHPFSIIDEYIRLAHLGHRIGYFLHAADDWLDVGRPETLQQAQSWKVSCTK